MDIKKIVVVVVIIITGLLISGCIGSTSKLQDRTYHFYSGNKIPINNDTMVLRSDGTFIINSIVTNWFGYITTGSDSGTYSETDKSVILDYSILTEVLTKNQSNNSLVKPDGGVWVYVTP